MARIKKMLEDANGNGGTVTLERLPLQQPPRRGGGEEAPEPPPVRLTIKAPNFQTIRVGIIGTAPYVQNRFSMKARETIRGTQVAGSRAKKGKAREPKDFDALYEGAQYHGLPLYAKKSDDPWHGIPAAAFRNAMISACRMVGYKMTMAKLSVFIIADGFDTEDGTALVRITKGEPHYHEGYVRNATGVVDLRARPMWDGGWEASVTIKFDGDQFAREDVANLLMRAGLGGVGEGRPDSKSSAGLGWGTFDIREVK